MFHERTVRLNSQPFKLADFDHPAEIAGNIALLSESGLIATTSWSAAIAWTIYQ